MADVKFFDLKPGLTLPAMKVRSVALMTNGDVRLYYDEPVKDDPQSVTAAFTQASAMQDAANARNAMFAEQNIANQRKLERDMASGPGSKKKG